MGWFKKFAVAAVSAVAVGVAVVVTGGIGLTFVPALLTLGTVGTLTGAVTGAIIEGVDAYKKGKPVVEGILNGAKQGTLIGGIVGIGGAIGANLGIPLLEKIASTTLTNTVIVGTQAGLGTAVGLGLGLLMEGFAGVIETQKSPNSSDLANAQQAKVEEAKKLNIEGCELHNQKKQFAEAAIKFKDAYDKCPDGHADKKTYKKNLDLANAQQAKVEAATKLCIEGCELHDEKKQFAEAAVKFKEAYDTCPDGHANKETYRRNLDRANTQQAKVEAATKQKVLEHIVKAQDHNAIGNYDKAIKSADAALAIDADNTKAKEQKVLAYVGKAVTQNQDEQYDKAIKSADAALAIDPDNTKAKEQKDLATTGESIEIKLQVEKDKAASLMSDIADLESQQKHVNIEQALYDQQFTDLNTELVQRDMVFVGLTYNTEVTTIISPMDSQVTGESSYC